MMAAICLGGRLLQADEAQIKTLGDAFQTQARPLIFRYCRECHSGERIEAEIDLASFSTLADVRKRPQVWQKVGEMLDSRQMPPKDARQPTPDEHRRLQQWVHQYLTFEAQARAGDPGRVVLRRLNNAQYTYTLRDLTGIDSLDPAREFPIDSAAGEGFTNTGNSLVMSPALVTKYLDAAKEVARHAVLLPDGFRFSPYTTRRDWTNDALARIRALYRQHTDSAGASQVNLQGIVFNTNDGGRLSLGPYLAATIAEREALAAGSKTIDAVARERSLNAKYLSILWTTLNDQEPSMLLDVVRNKWRAAKPDEVASLAAEIGQWQKSLWRFTSVGHIGKLNGPQVWQEPVTPLAARQELRLKIPTTPDKQEVALYLVVGDAGDGNQHDFAVWERPRLVAPGRADLLLSDVGEVTRDLASHRQRMFQTAAKCLNAAAEAASEPVESTALARKYDVDPDVLLTWLDYLGIGAGSVIKIDSHFTQKNDSAAGYNFIKGWGSPSTPNVAANSSDQHVRIPGNMKPHSVAMHPSPTLQVVAGWQSPISATVRVEASVQHAHPECGNGVTWSLHVRRGNTRQRLAGGIAQGAKEVGIGPFENVRIHKGDLISLEIGPRDGNHSCDLTAVDLTIKSDERQWNLARDVSPDVLAGNPHADGFGNPGVWYFFPEPVAAESGPVLPADPLLAKWQSAADPAEKQRLAAEIQTLLTSGPPAKSDSPDAALYRQLVSLSVSRSLRDRRSAAENPESAKITVQAPSIIEIRLPRELAEGCELVTAGTLHPETGAEGSVQFQVLTAKPVRDPGLLPTAVSETNLKGAWTSNNRSVSHATPIIVTDGSAARRRFEAAFTDFRRVFPAALCYTKIVPVDEVVTLTLFYREDAHLMRLMLDEDEQDRLNALWGELHYVSHDALTLVDAFEQLWQYATQDADPKVFEPLRKPIQERAAAFRRQLVETEPKHLNSLIDFASQAYRRPITDTESAELRALYQSLRKEDIAHDEAFRLTLARVLVAPAFLYRVEKPGTGAGQGPVSRAELASRLSYFLWSSQPDGKLRQATLDAETLVAQTRRMLRDAKVRRLATEFACQWLHIYDFDHLDEKSERHFPTFAGLRGDMYEESIQFFTHLFQTNGSVLEILDADYTLLNESLAKHYGIPGISGDTWRRVDGVQRFSRGGILGQATALAKQSGASRTSPILRGNWISEVLLGERLPRPPKGVPQLPEEETSTAGLTVRQLVEKHTSDGKCSVCHARIDPLGFALEGFDAIGRRRDKDLADQPIDTRVKTIDAAEFTGLDGLRQYLLTTRRDAFLRQFCRKLLGYALGRGVQLSDEPLLAEMQTAFKEHNYRVGTAIETIVLSRQFRELRGRDAAFED